MFIVYMCYFDSTTISIKSSKSEGEAKFRSYLMYSAELRPLIDLIDENDQRFQNRLDKLMVLSEQPPKCAIFSRNSKILRSYEEFFHQELSFATYLYEFDHEFLSEDNDIHVVHGHDQRNFAGIISIFNDAQKALKFTQNLLWWISGCQIRPAPFPSSTTENYLTSEISRIQFRVRCNSLTLERLNLGSESNDFSKTAFLSKYLEELSVRWNWDHFQKTEQEILEKIVTLCLCWNSTTLRMYDKNLCEKITQIMYKIFLSQCKEQ